MLLHSSNLRAMKRIDLLLEAAARLRSRIAFKLVILAGADFGPFIAEVQRLGLTRHVIVRESVSEIEDYLQAADLGLFTSESESFCLSILELMTVGCPSAAFAVGGIPEVVCGNTGMLVPFGDVAALVNAAELILRDPGRREAMSLAGRLVAKTKFSADAIVPLYEALYSSAVSKNSSAPQAASRW